MTSAAERVDFLRAARDSELELAEFNRWSGKHERKICYDDARAIAIEIQVNHPEWLVCGSLALMLCGYLKTADVSDVDFVTNSFPEPLPDYSYKYNKSPHKNLCSYYHVEYKEFVDLFIHPRPVFSELGKTYRGLRIQKIEDVLYWKNHFNRDKDKSDLLQIHLDDSLFEI